jgi:hypothetical protein
MSGRAMIRSALLVTLAVLLTGCGSSAPGPLVPVTGTVAYRGQPLPGGMIVFTPDSAKGGQGPISSATIQPDGSFSLSTGENPGAVPGWHRITVVAISEGETNMGSRYPIPVSLIPEKYRSGELSGLSREVRPGQENTIHLNLD